MRQGVYKQYRRFRHNDANVHGTIDISRHIRENIPFSEELLHMIQKNTVLTIR